jgi:hypothetical protein
MKLIGALVVIINILITKFQERFSTFAGDIFHCIQQTSFI